MGFYDTVRVDDVEATLSFPQGTVFETKSLYAGGAEFTITVDGKLVEHLFRYEYDPEQIAQFDGQRPCKRIDLGNKVIEYHGDLLLMMVAPVADLKEFVARFTHGRLEWIRPEQDYPTDNLVLLKEQGAR